MSGREVTRLIAGVLAILAIFAVSVDTCVPVTTGSGQQSSAIQITQVYSQGTFAALVIGVLLLSVYAMARGDTKAGERATLLAEIRDSLRRIETRLAAPTDPSSLPDSPGRLPTLSPDHSMLVRDFLARRDTMDPTARSQLATRAARSIAAAYGLEALLASEDAETFLGRFTSG